uniref:Verticillium wilt resistance-like protein n=1 Tax=Humulus lupulus TaxID=3486 RepID=A0A068LBG1_HUMLU|nr:verticillium wilt resistance-like protein [Humulus lupulus]
MIIHLFSWLFVTPICLILLSVEPNVALGQCLGEQQSLLLQLKSNLVFNANKSTKLVTWSSNSDCSAWEGVSLDGEGRVTGLSLSSEWISYGIHNSSLFKLQHLKSLDVSLNNFNSTIPDEIGNLSALSHLNLSNAGFVGQIPITISHLTNLVTLDISTIILLMTSTLKLENPDLGMLVQNLSKLEELYLDGVNMSAPGSEWCKALSSSVPKLRVLSLTNCDLSGPLDESLEKLHSLSVISLSYNNLSTIIPAWFANFSNLTSLTIDYCELYGNFPKQIFQVPTLRNIDVSYNPLLHGFLPDFPQNSSLQRLVLSSSNFSGRLPKSIGNLSNLSRLDFHSCNFIGALPHSMGKLSQLVYLDLSFNKFVGPIQFHWEGLLKLINVDMTNNSLGGTIPIALFALPSVQRILLSFNNFRGQVPEFPIPSSSMLETLALSNNNLEGNLPRSIFELRKLRTLLLSFNKFNGTVQFDVIQLFRNISSLDLSYNNLSVKARGKGSTFLSFPELHTLKLASCKLSTFPDLKNHSRISHLDLSDNQLHGEIPYWIWELDNGNLIHLNLSHNHLMSLQEPYSPSASLVVLDLHSNQLQGKIPSLPPACSYVDFSSNNFTSSIPADIGDYLNIIFFSVSNNHLTGIVPKSICNATYLQVLDLSYNNLSKEIPKCLFVMVKTLGVLNVRSNNFRGSIPDAFPVDCSLETLDLNGNSIEGQIPSSLIYCTRLEVLDLGNNDMSGNFPCLLKNISALRVIVLRSNKFQGHIGCQKSSRIWENLQIVDLAHNNFSGDLSGQFLKLRKATLVDDDNLKHLQYKFLEFSASGYYQDTVTVTFKGLEINLPKILTLFTSIDLSCNRLVGSIPEEVGQLRALYFLNLSGNALTGRIPSSIGNMEHLESLDLSNNKLNGSIPSTLASLNFLSFLNLSYNDLTGPIPSGNQIQTFLPESFIGNKALWGCPLTDNCGKGVISQNTTKKNDSKPENEIDWNLISAEIGLVVGFGAVIVPIVFCKRWRKRYFERIDDVGVRLFPQLYQTSFNKNRRRRRRRRP